MNVQLLDEARNTGQGWWFVTLLHVLWPCLGLWTRAPAFLPTQSLQGLSPTFCSPHFPFLALSYLLFLSLARAFLPFLFFLHVSKIFPSFLHSGHYDLVFKFNVTFLLVENFSDLPEWSRSHKYLPGLLHTLPPSLISI